MSRSAVHQFHSGSAPGDAVTNGLIFTRGLLRDLGFESEIFVQHVAPELAAELRPHTALPRRPGDWLLAHHSMGHDLGDWLLDLPQKKILVYHNITPAEFFPPGGALHHYAQLGRRQLRLFLPAMAAAIGDSDFNSAELRELGYGRVATVPLLFDTGALLRAPCDPAPAELSAGVFTILFVGRVCANKRQHLLIEAFARLRQRLGRPARLVLVGGYDRQDEYFLRLTGQVSGLGLGQSVVFTGKVPQPALAGWYRAADLFVCASEHEGFGVPLIEAMLFNVPVVAVAGTTVAKTLGGAGVLVEVASPALLAATMLVIAKDRELRRAVARHQRRRLARFDPARLRTELADILAAVGVPAAGTTAPVSPQAAPAEILFEGPAETSYSLAIVNRSLATAMERLRPGTVAFHPTEGPGDYQVNHAALAALPELAALVARARPGARSGTVIRNMYPPRLWDSNGDWNCLYFSWEESLVPLHWVRLFNKYADHIFVPSAFVRDTLLNNGVDVPITVTGHGLGFAETEDAAVPYPGLPDGFRFLHVSSCFPRKGADVLLRAFGRAFSAQDDVSLVIKTFPNPHNDVEAQLAQLRAAHPDFPRVTVISRDLPTAALASLYRSCDVFVAPTRGEGFGLPIAEAMSLGLPVIATELGGHRDFCDDTNSWLLRARFAEADSHLAAPGSLWTEPDCEHLTALLREARQFPPAIRRAKTAAARTRVRRECDWSRCATVMCDALAALPGRPLASPTPPKLGWVSTWNERCGIAGYTRHLLDVLPRHLLEPVVFAAETAGPEDGSLAVRRCWHVNYRDRNLSRLEQAILEEKCAAVVIQFNFGFFHLGALAELAAGLEARGVRVLLCLHSTADVSHDGYRASLGDHVAALRRVSRLLVHSLEDLNRLAGLGLAANAALFPHGLRAARAADPARRRQALGLGEGPVLATYGFLLPHKGALELIEALPLVREKFPTARLLLVNSLHPSPESARLRDACAARAQELGVAAAVTGIHDFLPEEESLLLLQAADLVVFPYQRTNESSSAAVRHGIAANRPVACTPLPIFDDIAPVAHRLPGFTPRELADGIVQLLAGDLLRHEEPPAVREWKEARAWPACAQRLVAMVRGLCDLA